MLEVDLVTAKGRGTWGHHTYDIEFADNSRTRWDSTGGRHQTSRSFDLLVRDSHVGRRRFRTETDRTEFVDRSLTELKIAALNPPEERPVPYLLAGEIGQEMEGVHFVCDYISLNFTGGLNLYVWPSVHRAGEVLNHGDPGYTDALVGLIDETVSAVDELLDLGLVINFSAGTKLVVPLDGTGTGGWGDIAEYGVRDREDGREEMTWTVGDDHVEWLTGAGGTPKPT
jgi:hypothetical protein